MFHVHYDYETLYYVINIIKYLIYEPIYIVYTTRTI